MAKVEMSLHEYNELKESLDFYKRVIKEITTPAYDSWSDSYYKSNKTSEYSVSNKISEDVEEFLKAEVLKNTPKEYKDYTITPRIGSSMTIAEVAYPESLLEEEDSDND